MRTFVVTLILAIPLPLFAAADESPPAPQETPADSLRRLQTTFELSLSLHRPTEVREEGLAALHLYVGALRLEPPAVDKNGNPISADVRISSITAAVLIRYLERDHFFTRAHRGYSERREDSYKSSSPPTGHVKRPPRPDIEAWGSVRVLAHDADWYRYYEEVSVDRTGMRDLFSELAKYLNGPGASALQTLQQRLDKKKPPKKAAVK
jgi:hypothetical protein